MATQQRQPSHAPFDAGAEFSDDDDLRLFQSCGNPDLVGKIIGAKRNDPEVRSLLVGWDARRNEPTYNVELSEATSRRLGDIVRQNTTLKNFGINYCPGFDVEAMCAGLQHNRSIRGFIFIDIDLEDPHKMNSLAPFLRHNPRLKRICLGHCRIGPESFDVLSSALSDRAGNTLVELHLHGNPIGDAGFEGLFQALDGGTRLRKIDLRSCRIGCRTSVLLAALLQNQESQLTELNLQDNSIDDESTVVLARSLARNNKLKVLHLDGNNSITTVGGLAMLKLVCDTSSIGNILASNNVLHTLYTMHLDLEFGENEHTIIRALSEDDGNLLHASLDLNRHYKFSSDKSSAVRQKLIWGHVREDLNLGTADIDASAMPRILAWFGDDSDAPRAGLVQYHKKTLAPVDVRKQGLSSVFRILQQRPNLCSGRGAVPDARRAAEVGAAEAAIRTLCAMDESVVGLLPPGHLKEKVARIRKLCGEIDGSGDGSGAKRHRV